MSDPKIFDKRSIIRITLGTLIGGLAVYLAFRGVSLTQLAQVIKQANSWLMLLGLLIILLNVATLALRWWVMLIRPWSTQEYGSILGSIYLGQMFNILLPVRLGELARIYFVNERLSVPKSRLLGSLVLEKVLEIITFGGAVLFLITAISLPAWVTEPGWTLIWMAVISVMGVIVLAIWGRSLLALVLPLLKRLPPPWGERLAGILERALEGFDSMRDWKRQLPIWLLSIFSLFLSALTNYFILEALDIQIPYYGALFVLIVLQVGSAPPSSPGKLGVFHYLAVLALAVYGINKDLALSFGVLLYIIALLPKVIIGAMILVFSKWNMKTLISFRENGFGSS